MQRATDTSFERSRPKVYQQTETLLVSYDPKLF
jgi:hypothetical protein